MTDEQGLAIARLVRARDATGVTISFVARHGGGVDVRAIFEGENEAQVIAPTGRVLYTDGIGR